jgi:hypothetical protein
MDLTLLHVSPSRRTAASSTPWHPFLDPAIARESMPLVIHSDIGPRESLSLPFGRLHVPEN